MQTSTRPQPSRRSDQFQQSAVLEAALRSLSGSGDIAVFDLDSTLLDNKPRQARILREFGALIGDARIAACRSEFWVGWDFETPLSRCGLGADEVTAVRGAAKDFWKQRFFTSEYCVDDEPNPGAAEFLRRVRATGATICYVTGRHTPMGDGSVGSFRRAGFPIPGETNDVHLLLKPTFELGDDDWKIVVRERLDALGRVACAFDNEPSHINNYRLGYPGCWAVHLDTDHSGRPVEVLPEIPSVRDFVL